MNIELKIQGRTEMENFLLSYAPNQIRYAFARSLTMTAKDGQAAVLEKLPTQFALRTPWYKPGGKYGFRIKSATKSMLRAEIYTDAMWMQRQEEGGIKTPHGKMLAIPTMNVRRTKRDLIPVSQRPRALIGGQTVVINTKSGKKEKYYKKNKNAFIGPMKSGKLAIWLRQGTGHKKMMYVLIPKAKVSPRLFFYATTNKTIAERFHANFWFCFKEAIRTAKPGRL